MNKESVKTNLMVMMEDYIKPCRIKLCRDPENKRIAMESVIYALKAIDAYKDTDK